MTSPVEHTLSPLDAPNRLALSFYQYLFLANKEFGQVGLDLLASALPEIKDKNRLAEQVGRGQLFFTSDRSNLILPIFQLAEIANNNLYVRRNLHSGLIRFVSQLPTAQDNIVTTTQTNQSEFHIKPSRTG